MDRTADILAARIIYGGPLQHPIHERPLRCQPENIPAFLRRNARWAPFALVPKPGKPGKFDKVPRHAGNIQFGLSTAKPASWFSFAEALGAYQRHAGTVHGIGYCLTGPHGIVGVDLDGCSDYVGRPTPWAAEVLREAKRRGYYVERSPSGTGFRVLYAGETPEDWTNKEAGIEVYGGHDARFLTVTGHAVREVIL